MIERTLVLEGPTIRLEPLARAHLGSLRHHCNDKALWEFTAQSATFDTIEGTEAWFQEALTTPDHVPFAIVDRATGETIGSTRYADIQPQHRKVEIGWTFIARKFWRTHVNTECKFLLLSWAFDEWNALRVSLKANAVNIRSRNAIERIGAKYEGTLRNFRVNPRTGESVDAAYYSIILPEWPAVKTRLADRSRDSRAAARSDIRPSYARRAAGS